MKRVLKLIGNVLFGHPKLAMAEQGQMVIDRQAMVEARLERVRLEAEASLRRTQL